MGLAWPDFWCKLHVTCMPEGAYGPLVVVSAPDSFSILTQSLWESWMQGSLAFEVQIDKLSNQSWGFLPVATCRHSSKRLARHAQNALTPVYQVNDHIRESLTFWHESKGGWAASNGECTNFDMLSLIDPACVPLLVHALIDSSLWNFYPNHYNSYPISVNIPTCCSSNEYSLASREALPACHARMH